MITISRTPWLGVQLASSPPLIFKHSLAKQGFFEMRKNIVSDIDRCRAKRPKSSREYTRGRTHHMRVCLHHQPLCGSSIQIATKYLPYMLVIMSLPQQYGTKVSSMQCLRCFARHLFGRIHGPDVVAWWILLGRMLGRWSGRLLPYKILAVGVVYQSIYRSRSVCRRGAVILLGLKSFHFLLVRTSSVSKYKTFRHFNIDYIWSKMNKYSLKCVHISICSPYYNL